MPIDTAQKRASALTFNAVWRMPAVPADGGFEQADRQQILWNYSGILVVVPHVPTPIPAVIAGRQARRVLVSWVRLILDEWRVSLTVRQSPERSRVRAILPEVGLKATSRLIAVSAVRAEWQSLRIDSRIRLEAKISTRAILSSPIYQAEAKLFIGMTHIQRLLDDEIAITILLGQGR